MKIRRPSRSIRYAAIAALAILTAQATNAQITVAQRATIVFSVSREGDTLDAPPQQVRTDLEPVDLSLSSAVGSSGGMVHVTSQITNDLTTGVFEVSGTGVTEAHASGASGAGQGSRACL